MASPADSPAVSKYSSSQLAPVATWAAVGGQGKFCESVAASPLVESVPVAGGPRTPEEMTTALLKPPLLLVFCGIGILQLTGIGVVPVTDGTVIVGCGLTVLQTARPPPTFLLNPE